MVDHSVAAFAHRGGGFDATLAGFAENTAAAFQYVAQNLHYKYFETDIRAAKDGTLYAWHGKGLERLLFWKPLDLTKFGKRDVATVKHHGAPLISTLDEVLDALPKSATLSVDLKHSLAIQPLVDLILRRQCMSQLIVGSFVDGRVQRVVSAIERLTGQTMQAGMGINGCANLLFRSLTMPGLPWKSGRQVCWTPYNLITPGFVRAAHAGGLQIYAWTVNEQPDMLRMLALGVDGILTDRLQMLKELLVQKKVWS